MSKKYKIGDRVLVEFIASKYEGTIVSEYRHNTSLFCVRTEAGLFIPAVGYPGNPAKNANIIPKQKSDSDEKTT